MLYYICTNVCSQVDKLGTDNRTSSWTTNACTFVCKHTLMYTHKRNESSDRCFLYCYQYYYHLLSTQLGTMVNQHGQNSCTIIKVHFWKCTFLYVHNMCICTYSLQHVDSVYEVSTMYFALCLCMQFGKYISLTHTHTYMQLSHTHTTALN